MNSAKLFFAGDFCSRPSSSFITASDELISLIQSCDVKVVNFEVPLKPQEILPHQRRERFFQHDDVPQFLRELGFNLFSIANNHTFDWGDKGFEKTKLVLGDDCFGAGTYDEAYQVKVVEVNGVKLGFLSLTYAAYTGVFDDVANHEGLGCAYINDLKVNHVIVESKKEVDYLFILAHDGLEYIDVPTPETIARYRDFIDYGADGVFGSHPHCPQGWEEYNGKPIFYSLGNFFFNSKKDTLYRAWNRPHWYEGMCVLLAINDGVISYEIVNTRNIDNEQIVVDNTPQRNEHNYELQSYLVDKEKYNTYFLDQCSRLSGREIVDMSIHSKNIKIVTKTLLHRWVQKIRHRPFPGDFHLITMMRNDSRRTVYMRTLK